MLYIYKLGEKMIDKEKTKLEFGYDYDSLAKQSSKKVCVICDYCKNHITKTKKAVVAGYKDGVIKDSCMDCRQTKKEEVSLLKFGVKNSAQRQDVKQKLRSFDFDIEDKLDYIIKLLNEGYSIENISEKVGVPSTTLNRFIKQNNIVVNRTLSERIVNTYKEKYGENYKKILAEDSKNRIRNKYGVDNVFELEITKEKIKQTNLDKYGESHYLKTEEGKEKLKQTNIDRHGVENIMQLPETKSKIAQTNYKKYGYKFATQSPEVKKKSKLTRIKKGLEKEFRGLSVKEMADAIGVGRTTMNLWINKYGYDEAVTMTPYQSSLESHFENLLQNEKIEYVKQFRVNNRIADFKINDLLIECDGLWFHREKNKGKTYHADKRRLYIENGYFPLFFRDNEISSKSPIILSIIKNKLGLSNRIFARKTQIGEVGNNIAKAFFEENHLMGSGQGRTFGLFSDDNLVSCLQIKKKKDATYEVSRFSNSTGTNVIGGFSRLLKKAQESTGFNEMYTFIDLRYGSGDYLEKLGFSQEKTYLSFNWSNGTDVYHRRKFLGNAGYNHGLFKIWDCGQAKWTKVYK